VSSFYVYQLSISGSSIPFYVGKGKGARARQHTTASSLKVSSRKNGMIKGALKAGLEIVPEILLSGLTEAEAFEVERLLIASYGRLDRGTGCLANHTDGGDGASDACRPMKEETKRKLSDARRNVPLSLAHRRRISEGLRRSPRPNSLELRAIKSAYKTGEKNPSAKLSEADVIRIYEMLRQGQGRQVIAAQFGIHPGQVDRIRQGRKWAHLHHHFSKAG
jgi:hypothetical protein